MSSFPYTPSQLAEAREHLDRALAQGVANGMDCEDVVEVTHALLDYCEPQWVPVCGFVWMCMASEMCEEHLCDTAICADDEADCQYGTNAL